MPNTTTSLEAATMNEATIQFIMRAFSILICIVIGLGMATLCAVVIRDGSTPLVTTALDDIKVIAIGGFSSIVVMVTGRSIVSNTIQSMLGQTSTTTSTTTSGPVAAPTTTSLTTITPATVPPALPLPLPVTITGGSDATSGGTQAQS
jgi:hypothetical protein